jgi:hypothetical protein
MNQILIDNGFNTKMGIKGLSLVELSGRLEEACPRRGHPREWDREQKEGKCVDPPPPPSFWAGLWGSNKVTWLTAI